MSNDLTPRIEKAATLLAVEIDSLTSLLDTYGISNDSTGVTVLDSSTTTISDLVNMMDSLPGDIPKLKVKAAAGMLKAKPEEKLLSVPVTPPVEEVVTASIAHELKMARPIEQWSDEDLLQRFSEKREVDVEEELNRRAKNQSFIVLVQSDKGYVPGKEVIDFVESLRLLKDARRKKINPTMIPVLGGVRPVYRINEFNVNDRMTELCPLCGKGLYRGFCDHCVVNFTGVDDDSRAFMSLVVKMDTFSSNSTSDRKALVTSAQKGLGSLKSEWPSLVQEFDELKATNSLPQVRVVASRPSKADPFFIDGSRSVGNKKF